MFADGLRAWVNRTNNVRLARGLAERGHRVFVVTNAGEVEQSFRIPLQPRVEQHPMSSPFVSTFAGMALRVMENLGQTDLDGGIRTRGYDAVGNLIARSDPLSEVTWHANDAARRRT